jgi:hypothetical protein
MAITQNAVDVMNSCFQLIQARQHPLLAPLPASVRTEYNALVVKWNNLTTPEAKREGLTATDLKFVKEVQVVQYICSLARHQTSGTDEQKWNAARKMLYESEQSYFPVLKGAVENAALSYYGFGQWYEINFDAEQGLKWGANSNGWIPEMQQFISQTRSISVTEQATVGEIAVADFDPDGDGIDGDFGSTHKDATEKIKSFADFDPSQNWYAGQNRNDTIASLFYQEKGHLPSIDFANATENEACIENDLSQIVQAMAVLSSTSGAGFSSECTEQEGFMPVITASVEKNSF